MPISLEHEGDNLFRIDIRGTLRQRDLEQCQGRLTREMERFGSLRLLLVLAGFEGWEPTDNWSDLTFYAKYGDNIQRIAIVGDERWRSETLMFAGADLRTAPVEFFPAEAVAEARGWLSR